MASTDIKPFGSSDAIGYFWVQFNHTLGRGLVYVAVNEIGDVRRTALTRPWAPAARSVEEAVVAHLSRGLTEADRDLERRRDDAPEPEPEHKPIDPATEKFFDDGDWSW